MALTAFIQQAVQHTHGPLVDQLIDVYHILVGMLARAAEIDDDDHSGSQ